MSTVTINDSFKVIIANQSILNDGLEIRQLELAQNLTDKGVNSSSTESLKQLTSKVKDIENDKHLVPGFMNNNFFPHEFSRYLEDGKTSLAKFSSCKCAFCNDYVYIAFGTKFHSSTDNKTNYDLIKYDTKNDTYSVFIKDFQILVDPSSTSYNSYSQMVSHGDYIYTIGGKIGTNMHKYMVKINTIDASYEIINMPFGSSNSVVEVVDDKCYIFGGEEENGASSSIKLKTVWCFDFKTEMFEQKNDMLIHRSYPRHCYDGKGNVYLFYGYTSPSTEANRSIHKYNIPSETNEIIAEGIRSSMAHKSPCFYRNGKIYSFEYKAYISYFDLTSKTFTDIFKLPIETEQSEMGYTINRNILYSFCSDQHLLCCNIDKIK